MSDLIDRQNAIDVLEILADKMSDEGQTVIAQAVAVLKYLHPAESERTAKVVNKEIDYRDDEYEHDRLGGQFQKGKCGICKHLVIEEFDFCPSCGAKLEWSRDE